MHSDKTRQRFAEPFCSDLSTAAASVEEQLAGQLRPLEELPEPLKTTTR